MKCVHCSTGPYMSTVIQNLITISDGLSLARHTTNKMNKGKQTEYSKL